MDKLAYALLLLLLSSCASKTALPDPTGNNSVQRSTNAQNTIASISRNAEPELGNSANDEFDCSKDNYNVDKGRDENNNLVKILRDDRIVEILKLPTGNLVNGFALNYVRKTKDGFVFSIEYGSRFYYEKEFYFKCEKGELGLYKVIVNSFDKAKPETYGKRKSSIRVKPHVPILEFSVENYMKE